MHIYIALVKSLGGFRPSEGTRVDGRRRHRRRRRREIKGRDNV